MSHKGFLKKLDEYFDFIKELKLFVTQSGVELKGLDDDHESLKQLAEKKPNEIISEVFYESIIKKLNGIDNILDAELNIKTGYLMDEKRYSTEILTENINKLFAEGVFERLSALAQYDLKECGMCLAFDRYTASSYHALRATEDVLKLFAEKLLGSKPKDSDTWAKFISQIAAEVKSKKIKPAPSQELMTNLDNLRKYYRNKTQHPVRKYSSDETQDLIGLCTKSISEMIKDLESRKLF
jgi:competence protein ComGF